MAYGSYYPTFYPQNNPYMQAQQMMPQNQPQMAQNTSPSNNTGIIWVQGESGAKSFPVGAGQSVLLMDSESSVMYIKSADQSGMPLPLRIFDYAERKAEHSEAGVAKSSIDEYVSRDEFEEFKEDVKRSIKGIRRAPVKEEEAE